jgi:hypothetical protein
MLFERSEAGWLANALFVAVVLHAISALNAVGYFDCSTSRRRMMRERSRRVLFLAMKAMLPGREPKARLALVCLAPTALGKLIPRGSRGEENRVKSVISEFDGAHGFFA